MFEVKEALSQAAREVLGKYTAMIPPFLKGAERVSFLIENFHKVSDEERAVLNETVNLMLRLMVERNASDIELGGFGTEGQVWFRIYGQKEPVPDLPGFTDDEAAILILSLLSEKQRRILEDARNLDFSYTFDHLDNIYNRKNGSNKKAELRFRVDAYFDVDRLALNMRSIIPELRPLEALNFHPNVLKLMSFNYVQQGLTLITGVTGSGKSTTLDAIIDWHNDNVKAHITQIAAPLEYVHRSRKCIIRQREVGKDVRTFHEGVIQALRQDLDIMVIGEMRDPATIFAALEVTDTGHKVFSTLHTSSAVESIDRIIAEVDKREQERVRLRLADVLTAIVSQKLVPSLDGKLVLAKEVLVVTPNVRAAIKNNNTGEIYMMINQGAPLGMITMEQELKKLYMENKISLEAAMQHANNKTVFKQILGLM